MAFDNSIQDRGDDADAESSIPTPTNNSWTGQSPHRRRPRRLVMRGPGSRRGVDRLQLRSAAEASVPHLQAGASSAFLHRHPPGHTDNIQNKHKRKALWNDDNDDTPGSSSKLIRPQRLWGSPPGNADHDTGDADHTAPDDHEDHEDHEDVPPTNIARQLF